MSILPILDVYGGHQKLFFASNRLIQLKIIKFPPETLQLGIFWMEHRVLDICEWQWQPKAAIDV